MFIYKIGIITRHKNKFDYKSDVPLNFAFYAFSKGSSGRCSQLLP